MSQSLAGVFTRPRHTAVSVTARGFEKRRESGSFVAVGAVNIGPDGRFTHPSDSFADVIIARRGGLKATADLFFRYALRPFGLTDENDSALLHYVKARTIVITPSVHGKTKYIAANVDGEVLPGPGPFRIHTLPSLLTCYGEY